MSTFTSNSLIARDHVAHRSRETAPVQASLDRFKDAMLQCGLNADIPIIADGDIHRFKPEGERRKNGWYVFFGRGGAFGNWRTGLRQTFYCREADQAEIRRTISKVRAAQRDWQKKLDHKHQRAKLIALRRWQAATAVIEHPYLDAKGVGSHGLRLEGAHLLIPVCHDGKVWSLQTISSSGVKQFIPGGRVGGGYFPIGTPGDRIWIAEGYATAATVHETTGDAAVCAFNAGNLEKVASHMRYKFRDRNIYVAADNDEAGISAAMAAMREHALEGAIWPDIEKADWNDYGAVHGPERTLAALNAIGRMP